MSFPAKADYERLLYGLSDQYSEIVSSTVHLYTNSSTSCIIRGEIMFLNGLTLHVFEMLDLTNRQLLSYFYAISRSKLRTLKVKNGE
jgi:hypothetical protein